MEKVLRVLLLVTAFMGFGTAVWSQEARPTKYDSAYSARFDQGDEGVMANLAKIKYSGLGYRFGEGSSFGVQIKKGVQVGLKFRFF